MRGRAPLITPRTTSSARSYGTVLRPLGRETVRRLERWHLGVQVINCEWQVFWAGKLGLDEGFKFCNIFEGSVCAFGTGLNVTGFLGPGMYWNDHYSLYYYFRAKYSYLRDLLIILSLVCSAAFLFYTSP
jgi:hypothetical protein